MAMVRWRSFFRRAYGWRFSHEVSLEAQTLAAVFTIEIPARLVGGKAMIVTGQAVAGGMGYRERGVPHQVRRKRPKGKRSLRRLASLED